MKLFDSLVKAVSKYNSTESGYMTWDSPFNPLMAPLALPFMLLVFVAIIDAVFGTRIISSLLDLLP